MDRALIDRRPAARINCYAGNFSQSNPQGLATWWRYDRDHTDAVNELVSKIQALLDADINVICINRWTGECQAQGQIIASECWNTMPAGRREALQDILGPAIAAWLVEDPTRRFGLYVSNMIRNDRDITKLGPGGDDEAYVHAPDMADPADRAYIHSLWDPVIELGFSFLWADNAALPTKRASTEAQYDAWRDGFFPTPVDFVQEAMPRVTGNKNAQLNFLPDPDRIYRQPAVCFWRFIRANEAVAEIIQGHAVLWTVDPSKSDLTVCLTSDESFGTFHYGGNTYPGDPGPVVPTRADVQSLLQRGFKVAAAFDAANTWVEGLTRAPEPQSVAFTHNGAGNTVTWAAGSAQDDEDVEIAVSYYEVFRADAVDGTYVKIGTSVGLSFFDPNGTAAHFYKVGSWTEYNASSIAQTAISADSEDTATVGWSFEGGVFVLDLG